MRRFGRFLTRSEGVLVGVDHHGIVGNLAFDLGKLSQRGLAKEWHGGGADGNHGGDAAEIAAGKTRALQIRAVTLVSTRCSFRPPASAAMGFLEGYHYYRAHVKNGCAENRGCPRTG